MALRTREAVLKQMPGVMKGEVTGRGSNRFGWLQTFRSCIKMLMTLMKWPVASVSFVLGEKKNKWGILTGTSDLYFNLESQGPPSVLPYVVCAMKSS